MSQGRERERDYRDDYEYDRERRRSSSGRRDRDDDRDRDRERDRGDRDRDRDRDRSRGRDERDRSGGRDDRDRSRERERDRRPRRRGWDDMGAMPQSAAALLIQQQQQFANALTMPMAPMQSNKKQRELYVGNVPTGMVTEPMLKELFTQMLASCEGFKPELGPAILNVQLCGGGTYAFIEFRDEELCETAMLFTGMELSGRQLKIGHPNGYIVPPIPVTPLKPPPELLQKFNITGKGPGAAAPEVNRKSRELYVGNLTTGAVTAQMLKELFTVPLQTIPGNENAATPPVIEVKLDGTGKFAFIEFRDEQICSLALSLFNNMELCGRPMHVARPAGYVPLPSDELPSTPALPAAAPTPMPLAPPAAPVPMPPRPTGPPPTHCLTLENLLTDAIIADEAEFTECVDDIRAECEQFGKMVSFEIPHPNNLGSRSAADVGKCFVRYELVSSAVKAYDALNGREFDGNTVKASFTPSS